MTLHSCFKAYDIRGAFPETLNERFARALGHAFGTFLRDSTRSKSHCKNHADKTPIHVVVGRDCRLSGEVLNRGLVSGLRLADVHVHDIGMCGTEEIYHASLGECAAHFRLPSEMNSERSGDEVVISGGVMITGSHNPANENGFKMIRADAVPIGRESGLKDIQARTLAFLENATQDTEGGSYTQHSIRQHFVRFLLDTVDIDAVNALQAKTPRPLRIYADAGNGCAGLVLQELIPHLPFDIILANGQPDGSFPHGVPNPLLPERRAATAQGVRETGADTGVDMGVAWDGDFDRCFFYDAEGNFIEGYYVVGLLAQSLLQDSPNESIIHDPRLIWNTQDIVKAAGGRAVESKGGHSYMKETMRRENALYGGEMSAHHFFRRFAYADSGMLPWLLVAKLLLRSGKSLQSLLQERMAAFPCSGEINRRVENVPGILNALEAQYAKDALCVAHRDGLSVEYDTWRCNVRASNTEPLLRLNVETRGDTRLLKEKTEEILQVIEGCAQG